MFGGPAQEGGRLEGFPGWAREERFPVDDACDFAFRVDQDVAEREVVVVDVCLLCGGGGEERGQERVQLGVDGEHFVGVLVVAWVG